uniref:Integrin, alpha 3b n=3 Tax=Nothobranchius TaxID=28779 RepID=A0A8C6M0V5_NOTFU
MFPGLLLCVAVAVYHGTRTCCGFNLDERFPVIKEGKTKGSLFGLSVALHDQTLGSGQYLLLVGAPKEKANSLPQVNETGAVYSCPISTDPADCSRINLVSATNPSEIVEGMWLGVTVASQRGQPDGRVLACGHRYVKIPQGGADGQRRMIGKCYVRGNDLSLDDSDFWQTDSYEICNPTLDKEAEGLCNLGISGGMTDTDVYLGSTGSFTWQGNVHVIWRDPDPLNSFDYNKKSFGKDQNRDSYIGYSVLEERKLLSRNDHTVVTGAPRDKSRGSVLFGKKTENSEFEVVQTIPGEQVGSYFGNSLAVLDLNNDDWNDLIVGAPFYFDRMKDHGGAVYIYMNENGSFQKTATMVLKGPASSGFGFALAAIGDVNQDGFQDFAVGAPFQDTGRVFIWMGSKKEISQKPSQVVEGKSVGNGLFKTFGYSISGGMDVDDNSYPDILVGSLDDQVALLRARPVIQLTKTFNAEPNIVDPNNCPADNPCITVTVCMSFTLSNGNKNFKRSIIVDYKVEADMQRRRSPRVRFRNNEDTYSGSLSIPSSKTVCEALKLSVVTHLRDKLEPVVFSVNMSLQEPKVKTRRSLQNLDAYPILSQEQKLTQRAEINFQKECGLDNKCSSNLQMTAQFADNLNNPYPRKDGVQVLLFDNSIKQVRVLVDVTNLPSPGRLAEDAHLTMLNVTFTQPLTYSGVRPESLECTTVGTQSVICELGNPIKGNEKLSLQIQLESSGIDLYTEEIEALLVLSTVSEQSDLMPVVTTMMIENVIQTTLTGTNVRTKFGGKVMGEYAMKNTSDVGSLVELTFDVGMNGQRLGNMGTLAVDFQWPYEVANGKWLLYLTQIVVSGQSEMECEPSGGVVNFLKLKLSKSKSKRAKRQAEDHVNATMQHLNVESQAATTLLTPRKKYLLDCSVGTARCVTFTCPLLNMSNTAKIHVWSRLWNSTMLEDYSDALIITVKGQATLKLITDKPTIKMDNQTFEFSVEIESEEMVEAIYVLPVWIIISSAVAGIVLLGIIILILWKLGFFKRSIYYRIMPKHQGVKIRRAERYQFKLGFQPEDPQKKYWITSWTEMQRCYY